MKLGIASKLFLAIVLPSLAVILLMAISLRISFHHDFLQYVNQLEAKRVQVVAVELGARYDEQQGWEFLRDRPRAWRHFLRSQEHGGAGHMMRHRRFMDPVDARGANLPPGPRIAGRMTLLDVDKSYIAGSRHRHPEAFLLPVRAGEETVGWLSLNPAPELTEMGDISFQRGQTRTGLISSLVSVLLAALVAIILARHFRAPIKDLVRATRKLSAGEFNTHIVETNRDELGQLQQDFNRLAQTLAKNEDSRRQWIADISHELRTPIAVLRGEIEALQDGVRQASPENLQSLHAEVLHINAIIEDLYQLSMSDIGALDYKMADLELAALIEEVLGVHEKQIQAQGIRVQTQLQGCRTFTMFGDEKRLHQLFANLLQNTLRYTDAGGELEIECQGDKDSLILHWRDSAPGVSDESLARLFDRLYRPERSRSRQLGGAGLGLAICKNIVEAHHGEIVAKHSPSGGVWIEMRFPTTDRM